MTHKERRLTFRRGAVDSDGSDGIDGHGSDGSDGYQTFI